MPRIESQLNHEEFKLKSELQIKNWKKRSNAEKKHAALAISQGLRIFAACEFGCSCCSLFFLSLPNLSLCNSDSLLIF